MPIPGCLDVVGARISDEGLEEGISQSGCVDHQTLNQHLEAGQQRVTQHARLYGEVLHQQLHGLCVLQGADL